MCSKIFFNFHDFWGSDPHPTPEIQKLFIKISFVPNALKVIFFPFFMILSGNLMLKLGSLKLMAWSVYIWHDCQVFCITCHYMCIVFMLSAVHVVVVSMAWSYIQFYISLILSFTPGIMFFILDTLQLGINISGKIEYLPD